MSDEHTIQARLLPDGQVVRVGPGGELEPPEKWVDRARLSTMTEEEIEANARADADNPPLTDDELKRLRPVPNPKVIRERLHMTQEQFALKFQVPLGTLRDWEQGARQPEAAARTLLRVIERNPQAVLDALAS